MKKASIILLFCLILFPFVIKAATYSVTNTNDSGAGSLRQAIIDANNTAEDDLINLNGLTGAVNLTTGELLINSNITISGPGARTLAVQRSTDSGTPKFRIFKIEGGSGTSVFISGIAIANGNVFDEASSPSIDVAGGGILVSQNNSLDLTEVTIRDNTANLGGGIYSNGQLNIKGSTISNNKALQGGGLDFGSGTINIINSTISDNVATGNFNIQGIGGGLVSFAVTNLNNVTVSNNTASWVGGGIASSTANPVSLRNTIVANNTARFGTSDISQVVKTLGHNLIGNGNTGIGLTPGTQNPNGDKVGTNDNPLNPQLGPLTNNGGQTDTRALLMGSPAINSGDNTSTTATDQRGLTRIIGGAIDIGAFEMQFPTTASVTVLGRVKGNNRGISKATVYLTNQNGEIRTALTNPFGYYRFEGVQAGGTYSFNVSAKSYRFSPRILTINQETQELNFITEP